MKIIKYFFQADKIILATFLRLIEEYIISLDPPPPPPTPSLRPIELQPREPYPKWPKPREP